MYNWCAKLAYDSYGVDFNGKLLKVYFMVNQARTQAVTVPDDKKDNDTTPANEIRMTISLPMYGVIDKDDVNGLTRLKAPQANNQCYLDCTIAHEMIHAVMYGNGTVKSYDKDKGVGVLEFFTEGIAELVALNDGSSLTLKNYGSHGATTFQLADGKYSYDRNTGTWQEKK